MSAAPKLTCEHEASTHVPKGADYAFLVLIGLYAGARVLQIYPTGLSLPTVIALHVIPTALFAIIHGGRLYGWRGMAVFLGVALLVGNISENMGVQTGFPFGHYAFTQLMGPKLFAVPILLGLAYVGMAYLSWTLARLIAGEVRQTRVASGVVFLPVLASFIMVAWDLSQDPVWSTVLRLWIWRDGGPYFGVPLSNFFGWLVTAYLIFQLFAFGLRWAVPKRRLPESYWRQAVIFYALSAAGNLILVLPSEHPQSVSDAGGVRWTVHGITAACALVTIFTMGSFILLAWRGVRQMTHPVASCPPGA